MIVMEQPEYIMDGKININKIKLLILFIFLANTVLLISCTLNTPVNNDTEIKNKKIETSNSKEQGEYYRLLLRFGFNGNPEPSELFIRNNFLNIQKEINLYLNQNYDYIELKFQSLYYIGYYTGNKNFAVSKETINQKINTGEKSFYATNLKTMQIGDKLSESFSSKIANGRIFEPKDFIISREDQAVNIILGNNYINEYNLGDTLNLELHKKNMEFKIIGFLEKGTNLSIDDKQVILDDYIIIPFYNIEYSPNSKDDETYQQIWYSQKNGGLIKPSKTKTINKLKEDINKINEKYDLFYEIADMPTKFVILQ